MIGKKSLNKSSAKFSFLLSIAIFGCKVVDPVPDFIVPEEPPYINQTVVDSSIQKEQNDKIECTYREVKWGPKYEEVFSLDPQGEIVFPGSIIEYNSFLDGGYIPIVGDRKPITISMSLSNITGIVAQTIDNPSLSTVRIGMQEILKSKSGSGVAQIFWKDHKIYSKEHFKLQVGGNYGGLWGNIVANFNFEDSEIIGRHLIEFTQIYYSIEVDSPQPGLENFFTKTPNVLSMYSPVYVSSVKYGRKVYLLIESKTSGFEQSSMIAASFRGFTESGGFQVDQTLSKLFKEKSIKGIVIGGNATDAVKLINDPSQLKGYLLNGANFSSESLGVPLSYNLKFVQDNSIARLVLYDEFTIRDCRILPENVISVPPPGDLKEFCPLRTGSGDGEFNGHGPKIKANVDFEIRGAKDNELWYNVHLELEETQPDKSQAIGDKVMRFYTAPQGKYIERIVNRNIEIADTDTDTAVKVYNYDGGRVATRIDIHGDTKDDDIYFDGCKTSDDSYISIYWSKKIDIVLGNL